MTRIDDDRLYEVVGLSSGALRDSTQRYGLCARDPKRADDWFLPQPAATSPHSRAAYERRAAELCGSCPVRPECLEFALREESAQTSWGIWGGLAPWQRDRLVAARRNEVGKRRIAASTIRALSEVAA